MTSFAAAVAPATATATDSRRNPRPAQVIRSHIPELDAIRAFGITMVILVHMWPHQGNQHRVFDVLGLSWILMDAFFVLSGFLIAGMLLDSRSRPDYYRSFYARRALRILPVYYLAITILTCGAVFLGTGYLYGGSASLHKWGTPWWFFVYLGNAPLAFTGVSPTAAKGSFGPLWSLQIEEQFYLLFPLLVRRLRLQTLARTLLCLACISPILRIALYWLYPANTLVQYVSLPCRMEGLALGAWIAVRFRQGPWNLPKRRLTVMTIAWAALTCLCGAWGGYHFMTPFNRTIGFLISSIACAHVVLWLIVFRGSRLTACLRLSPVRRLANISYGAYLFHMPIAGALLVASTRVSVLRAVSDGYLRVATVYVLTIIVASLSWHLFERPLLRLRDRRFLLSFRTLMSPPRASRERPPGSRVMSERGC